MSRPPVENGNQTTRLSAAQADRQARLLRDIQAVLNLPLLCPDADAELFDALGLTEVAGRVERVRDMVHQGRSSNA